MELDNLSEYETKYSSGVNFGLTIYAKRVKSDFYRIVDGNKMHTDSFDLSSSCEIISMLHAMGLIEFDDLNLQKSRQKKECI
jgi:hypothetical protein